ncbi:MAG: 5-deoxy-glucuronate isomerase [Clostridiales bacterium]|nr:5-deoxy-glucuronate isomerase [Clostridiales bacterium]
MFEIPSLNENNEKILCEMNGKNADMGMNIKVKFLKAGESISLDDKNNETAVLLVSGSVKFKWNGKEAEGQRANPFEMKPYCLHVSKNTPFTVFAAADSEIVIQQTDNDREFEPVFYAPEDCLYQEFGKGQWEGTGYRVVSTMFDIDNAPYSNMVMGEVFNKPGRWSSYPPHHHPQPEVYYYRFDKPQGFGACFNGDQVYKSVDGSFCTIHNGQDHQQVVAPCYTMYYVWMIRHIDGDPWFKTTRIVSPEHEWINKAD